MGSTRRHGVRFAATLGVVAVLVACGTYGEDPSNAPVDGSTSPTGDGGSDTGSPNADGSPSSDANAGDAPSDAPPTSYGVECPMCPGNNCFASGCDGANETSTCDTPIAVNAPMTLVAFICPKGPTATLPQACVPTKPAGVKNILPIRLGPANPWRVTVSGAATNSFVAGGTCQTINSCSGGTSGSNKTFPALALAMIGTTDDLTSCIQVSVTIEKD